MAEPWRMSAVDLATAIRERKLSSNEVVRACLDRIAAVNPKLNAVTVTLAEPALAAARAADEAVAAGEPLGPLHGVPFTIKENVDVAGSATTQGVVAMAEAIPAVDAPQVAALRLAGAIPIGRTNLPDFGLRWHTDNALRGPTKNPWDPARTPGGSSGGEAAALATGMTPLGIGNDYGGSLRWPSQCCGTAALKPTPGRIAQHDSLAPVEPPISLQLFAVQGPMARHVRDLRAALACMAAPSARDPWWTPAPLSGPEPPRRVALALDPGAGGIDPDVAAGLLRAAAALRDAGYEVEEVDPPSVAGAVEAWSGIVLTEVAGGFVPILEQVGGPDANRFLARALEAIPPRDPAAYMAGWQQRQAIGREWSLLFERYAAIVGPVSTGKPFLVGSDLTQAGVLAALHDLRLVVACNLLGNPAAVVPVGTANGLPQAVQVIGSHFREDVCLDVAEAIEARLSVITPIDPRASQVPVARRQ